MAKSFIFLNFINNMSWQIYHRLLSTVADPETEQTWRKQTKRFTGVQNLQTTPPTMCPAFGWSFCGPSVVGGADVVAGDDSRGKRKNSSQQTKNSEQHDVKCVSAGKAYQW